MLADEVTHVKMGSDWLRRLTAKDPERQQAGARLPARRRQAVQLRRLPRRGGGEPRAPRPQVPRAGRVHRRRDHRARRHRRRGLRRGAGDGRPRPRPRLRPDRSGTSSSLARCSSSTRAGPGSSSSATGSPGVWALGAHRWPALRTRALWWFTVVVEVAIFVQVGLGVGARRRSEARPAAVPHVLRLRGDHRGRRSSTATGQQLREQLYLLYGLGGLFLMGLGIRAMLVGRT